MQFIQLCGRWWCVMYMETLPEADLGLEKGAGGTKAKMLKLMIFITYLLRCQEADGGTGAQCPLPAFGSTTAFRLFLRQSDGPRRGAQYGNASAACHIMSVIPIAP